MKMRKIFATAAMALCVAVASAQVAKEDVRIYINPGHGSWGPNNRHMATIGHNPISTADPDTTDFFESNTNLRKGLALLEKLHEYGVPFDKTKNQTNENPNRIGAALDLSQNLVMSHVKCGPYPYSTEKDPEGGHIIADQKNDFNRTLSVIAAEVEANDFDMFISIHSNAATDGNTVNYLYFAYDDDFTGNDKTLSIEMSRCGWNHRILDRHTQWSHYDYTMTAADVAAGKGKIGYQGLGVLNHSVSGYLVEGYFHTYQPARHRYMNFDMCRLEGVDYARGVADYFGWEKEKTGDIVGIVRDKHEKFSDAVYTPKAGTYDVYKPLNGVVVKLMKGEEEVAVDTTDVNYNGLFAFRDVEPGDYTVKFSHADYKADSVWTTDKAVEEVATSIPVTVKAAVTAYPTAFLENVAYVPAAVVYVNYPDSLADKGFTLADEINIAGTAKTGLAEAVAGKTVRRTIVRDDYMYVLAVDAENKPYVYLFDVNTDALVKTLGTTATIGDILPLSDIALTAEGVLVGINKCNQAYGGSNNVTAYKWENGEDKLPEGEAQVWWTNNFAGNWSNGIAGETITYNGTLADGQFIYSGSSTGGGTRIVIAAVSEGQYLGYMRNNQDGTYLKTQYTGDTFNMILSPNADDQIIFDSETIMPFEIQLNPTDVGVPTILGHMAEGTVAVAANNASYFKYAGHSLMAVPALNAEGKVEGVKLFDITEGIANATEIVLAGATLAEPVEAAYASAHGELALTLDELSGITKSAEIELFLVADGNVTKFTTAGVKQPVYSGVYAYNLAASVAENTATVSFNLNDKSHKVSLVLTPVEEGAEEVVYEMGALQAGAHSYEVDLTQLAEGDYNWAVSVANKKIASGDILTTMNTWGAGSTYYRGGVAVETNPESEYFGTTYLGVGRSKGVFLLDPMYQVKEGAPYWAGSFNTSNASSTFRGALYNDKFYLTDWSDAYPGIWIFDPANPTAINNIFAGATNDGTGKLTIDGVAVGGGSTGVAFTGEGADRKMFIYVEDLPSGNGGNKLYRYDIGAEDTWGAKEPVQLADASAKLVNTNTGMLGSALHNVVFCSQTRYSGSNTAGVPAFIVIDEEGNIIFNSADLVETLDGCQGGGMALSADETKFAIVDGSASIQVYDVEWNENVPSFTHVASIPTKDQEICQMSFDYAGNLHCINRKHGYFVHAVPCEVRDVVTPAKVASVLTGTKAASGIEEVDADANAPVEYYNLQGVKVANPENGIFIKKQGNKTTKVVL